MSRLVALLLGAAGAGHAACALAITVHISCAEAPRKFPLPPPGEDLIVASEGRGWIEFGENGQQIELSPVPSTPAIKISQPLRFGRHWLELRNPEFAIVRRLEAGSRASGFFTMTEHCSASVEKDNHLDWLRKLSRIENDLDAADSREGFEKILAGLSELETTAPDADSRALVVHYRALTLSDENEFAKGAEEFGKAEELWRKLKETERSFAARVGRVESEGRAGALREVIAETEFLTAQHSQRTYFDSRLLNERCLALEQLGELERSNICYKNVLDLQLALGELPEYAHTAKNFANLLRKQGDLAQARSVAYQALRNASGPYAPLARGRLHLLLAEIDRQSGHAASSLQHIEIADGELEHAGPAALFSRGAARLAEARLYEQVGAYYEAYSALAQAAALWPPQESLALRARIFADIEADTHHFDSALFWFGVAEKLYEASGERPAEEATRLGRLRVAVQVGDTAEAERALAEDRHSLRLYEPQWQLLAVQVALAQGDIERAGRALDAARGSALALTDQVAYSVADAEHASRAGDDRRARNILDEAVQRFRKLAARVENPVLRYVVERQSEPLRRSAYQHIIDGAGAGTDAIGFRDAIRLFDVVPRKAAPRQFGDDDAARRDAFDQAVAAELLAAPMGSTRGDNPSGQRDLLAILTQSRQEALRSEAPPAVEAEQLQQALEPGAVLLAYLGGDTRGAFLCVTRDGAKLVEASAPDELRANISALNDLLHSASSPVARIDAAARRLSAALIGKVSGAPPPRLYVLADATIDAVPWSVLFWPDAAAPLVDTTAVSVVQLAEAAPGLPNLPDTLQMLTAAQTLAGRALPALSGADEEVRQVQSVVSATKMRVEKNSAPIRSAVLAALAEPGSWVHISAHGAAQPGRIGYAGLWLEPAARDATPPFLSWLDILDSGVRADLVVLNACRLGESGNVVGTNLSFAAAVARAGARHVIAAAWPISDSASALWVPAFYSTLLADSQHDSAVAMRAAQLRLRDSRPFRHPYFWASLRVIERLAVASVEASAGADGTQPDRTGLR